MKNQALVSLVFFAAAAFCLTPWMSSALALALGLAVALTVGTPARLGWDLRRWIQTCLSLAVIGLGAGMNLHVIGHVGLQGIGDTLAGISAALIVGTLLGRFLKVTRDTSLLITVGTAICGGSAIAAVAPVIKAKAQDVSVALGTVFILNAVALWLFPWIGHSLNLSEAQFGLWSALAIHDTSSVVGATLQYGPHALEVGTTVKLTRALWIIPIALLVGVLRSREESTVGTAGQAKKPWFILGFLAMAALVTWVPALQEVGHGVESAAKKLMVLTLFLIGASLNRETIKSVGFKPFLLGVGLWLVIGTLSLAAIVSGVIHS